MEVSSINLKKVPKSYAMLPSIFLYSNALKVPYITKSFSLRGGGGKKIFPIAQIIHLEGFRPPKRIGYKNLRKCPFCSEGKQRQFASPFALISADFERGFLQKISHRHQRELVMD